MSDVDTDKVAEVTAVLDTIVKKDNPKEEEPHRMTPTIRQARTRLRRLRARHASIRACRRQQARLDRRVSVRAAHFMRDGSAPDDTILSWAYVKDL